MKKGGGIGNLTSALDFYLAILRKNIGLKEQERGENGEWVLNGY